MEFIDADMAESKKFSRREDEMTTEEYNEYSRKYSQSAYDILRNEPKICKIIKKVQNSTLDEKQFPYVERPKTKKKEESKKRGAKNIGSEFEKKQDVLENPRIFLFVLGGLTHHEIASISNLQKTFNSQIIPGSNEIIASKDYMH